MRQVKKLSDIQEKRLVEEYRNGESIKKLMLKYNFATKKSITDKVKKHYPNSYREVFKEAKNNRKRYHINLTTINSSFNAYFIGLMLTDGYIQDKNRFGIQLKDEDCINFISKITGKEYKRYKTNNDTYYYRIIFSNNEEVENLKRFGITCRKSKTLLPLNLKKEEEKFLPYIIRGIIDGDGCIYYTSGHTPAFFVVTASYQFALWLKDTFEEKMFMEDVHLTTTSDGYYRVETAYFFNLLKLMAIVYNKPFGMNRKYSLLRKMFRDYNGLFLQDEEDGIVQTTTYNKWGLRK